MRRRAPVPFLAFLVLSVLALGNGQAFGGDKKVPDKGPIPGTEPLPGKGPGAKEGGKETGSGKSPTPIIRNHYELRALSYADTYLLLRFDTFTGRTWTYNMLRWQEIEETGKVSSGNYDILLIPLPSTFRPKDFRAFRIEQDSGTTWTFTANRWEEMKDR